MFRGKVVKERYNINTMLSIFFFATRRNFEDQVRFFFKWDHFLNKSIDAEKIYKKILIFNTQDIFNLEFHKIYCTIKKRDTSNLTTSIIRHT